jgi:antitoxin component YwqK of YwqJK toxin-antitoxin module
MDSSFYDATYEDHIYQSSYSTYENNIYREYYDKEKSKISFEVSRINGLWNGDAISYYSNGSILRITHYINNKKEGFYKEFDENNHLHHIEYNVNGVRHGFSKYFKGALCGTSIYINDKLYQHNDSFQQVLNDIRKHIIA